MSGGLFSVNKPPMKICMHMLNEIKPLLAESPLFDFPEDKSTTNYGRRTKRQRKGITFKLGQGGTLDELAEGVLGQSAVILSR